MKRKYRYFYVTGLGFTDNETFTFGRAIKSFNHPSHSFIRKWAIEQHGYKDCMIQTIHEFKTKADYEAFIK